MMAAGRLVARLAPLALPDSPWEVVGMAMPGPNVAAPVIAGALLRPSRRPARAASALFIFLIAKVTGREGR